MYHIPDTANHCNHLRFLKRFVYLLTDLKGRMIETKKKKYLPPLVHTPKMLVTIGTGQPKTESRPLSESPCGMVETQLLELSSDVSEGPLSGSCIGNITMPAP